MNESDKQIIRNCLPELVRTVSFEVRFQDLLVTKKVFSSQMMRDIQRNQSPSLELLICLMRRGPNDFQNFCEALKETYQNRALQILEDAKGSMPSQSLVDLPQHYHNWRTTSPASMETFNPRSTIPNEIPVSRSNSSAESKVLNPPNYEVQISRTPGIETISKFPALPVGNTFTIDVKSASTFKGVGVEGVYPCVLDGLRGLALILNYKIVPNHEIREGSELDVTHLEELFKQLGYKVIAHSDLNYSKTLKAVQDFRDMKEHAKADSTIVVIMSHGEDGSVTEGTKFLTSDGSSIGSEIIINHFNNHDCPNLHGKPKIFLFQFCRGNQHDVPRNTPVAPPYRVVIDGRNEIVASSTDVRRFSDILIANSTLPGFVAYREPECGAWFVKAICLMFMEYARDYHVYKLLNKVDQCMKGWTANEMGKQTVECTLREFHKKFFFNPGLVGGTN